MQRNTSQRRAIEAVFSKSRRPLSVQEALEAARQGRPTLGQATVYRAVNALVEAGRLAPVELPGEPMRYEVAGQAHHHHFHCRQCGKVFDVPGCAERLGRLVPRGFKLESHDIILYGRCVQCM